MSTPYNWILVEPPAPLPPSRGTSAADLDGTFGLDVSAIPDLDPMLALQGGRRVLAEAVARRLTTQRGSLFYAPDYGLDIRDYLNEGFTPSALFQAQSAIEAEVEKDERVISATVTLSNPRPDTLRISIRIEAADGPFEMVLSIDQLTVQLLLPDSSE